MKDREFRSCPQHGPAGTTYRDGDGAPETVVVVVGDDGTLADVLVAHRAAVEAVRRRPANGLRETEGDEVDDGYEEEYAYESNPCATRLVVLATVEQVRLAASYGRCFPRETERQNGGIYRRVDWILGGVIVCDRLRHVTQSRCSSEVKWAAVGQHGELTVILTATIPL